MKFDELIKELKECDACLRFCVEYCPKTSKLNKDGKCPTTLTKKAADAIEKLQSQLPKWIPVTERLPEVGQKVLFSYRGCIKKRPRIFIGWYNGKQWDSLFATEYDVTHWMPLPEPPKEE